MLIWPAVIFADFRILTFGDGLPSHFLSTTCLWVCVYVLQLRVIALHGRPTNVRNVNTDSCLHKERWLSMFHGGTVWYIHRVRLEIDAGLDDDPKVLGPVIFNAYAKVGVQPLGHRPTAKLIGS